MYEANVNTNCAYTSIVRIQACKYSNGNKGVFFFSSVSFTFTCIVSNVMFNSGVFCDSAADHNRVKEK